MVKETNDASTDKKTLSRLAKLLVSCSIAAADTIAGVLGAEQVMPSYEFNYVINNFGVEVLPIIYFTALGISYIEVNGVYSLYRKIKTKFNQNGNYYAHIIKIPKDRF